MGIRVRAGLNQRALGKFICSCICIEPLIGLALYSYSSSYDYNSYNSSGYGSSGNGAPSGYNTAPPQAGGGQWSSQGGAAAAYQSGADQYASSGYGSSAGGYGGNDCNV